MHRSPVASLPDSGRRQRNRAYSILKAQGPLELVWDAAMVGLKPARARCEDFIWQRRRMRSHDDVLRARVQGSKMYLNPRDVGISKELAIYKVHEPLATSVLRQIVTDGMVIIDIGANIGYYALIEAQGVGEGGRVLALEPVESNYALLVRNIRLNHYDNTTPIQVAIGDYTGKAKMYLSGKSNCHSIVRRSSSDESSEVDIMTLDRFVDAHGLTSVELVRMDIEGYEFTALDGMIGTLREFRPLIFLELHPHIKTVDEDAGLNFVCRLRDLGYDVQCVIDRVRDVPLRSWMAPVERMSIGELLQDSRLTTDRRPVSVLFRPRDGGGTAESVERE
jgi:FkbM family methyltransferase